MTRKPKVDQGAAASAGSRRAKAQIPASWRGEKPIFCFHHADRVSSEAWKFKPSDKEANKLLTFLCEMAGKTWGEIEQMASGGHRMHHYQELGSITRKARKDAERGELPETFGSEMFRFRLGSTRRLWGFRKDKTFHVVWWDPDHQVYPTEPS